MPALPIKTTATEVPRQATTPPSRPREGRDTDDFAARIDATVREPQRRPETPAPRDPRPSATSRPSRHQESHDTSRRAPESAPRDTASGSDVTGESASVRDGAAPCHERVVDAAATVAAAPLPAGEPEAEDKATEEPVATTPGATVPPDTLLAGLAVGPLQGPQGAAAEAVDAPSGAVATAGAGSVPAVATPLKPGMREAGQTQPGTNPAPPAAGEPAKAGTAQAGSPEGVAKVDAGPEGRAAKRKGDAGEAGSGKPDAAADKAGGAAAPIPATLADLVPGSGHAGRAPHAMTGPAEASAPPPSDRPGQAAQPPVPVSALPIEIGLRAMEGGQRFELRLHPEDLGRVDVRLDFTEDGTVKAQLTVDRVETLALLQRDARTLERAFEQAGLKTGSDTLAFSLGQSGAEADRRSGQHEPAPGQGPGPRADETETARATAGVEAALRAMGAGRGGLDIRI